ncbi:MAG: hypothetical protein A2544_00895 [Candidatus Zambryskibacteria bacterium RIFOXYD2_FULL_43_10]|uniref:Uncharacterized protein n=1 Tax=Candidatus Zambryskibacteria bacterium RIFOXYD2_FULL_43_10 TaxID=1802782 RepID=A0A1G2V603_9BACT|nr:MAG: hypothetical protein A2544_00895 [Candidatus Zambryskibacteria bacterium RIFOXYD2_FULL_43_10]
MNKKYLLFVILASVLVSGCVVGPVRPYGITHGFGFYQIGVTVRVVNNCTPFLQLDTVSGIEVKELPYGSSVTVHLTSAPFSGSQRQLSLTAKGYGPSREYLGSSTKIFHVSTYQGSREEVWEVDRLRLPGGRGGCR